MSLVSKRLHNLVTTPHAWRIAFARYFPGADALNVATGTHRSSVDQQGIPSSDKRSFTRLSALASWRSEYILRTRLLRSLGRGKPTQVGGSGGSTSSRGITSHSANAQLTYNSNLFTTVNHLDASFNTGASKKLPRFIHGADEIGSA